MTQSTAPISRNEYTVTVENMTLRLMVDPPSNLPTDATNTALLGTHTHAYTEIFACLEGSIALVSESGPIPLWPGDIALVPAEFRHVCLPTAADGSWKSLGVLPIRRHTRDSKNLYRTVASLCHTDRVLVKRHCHELTESIAHIEDDRHIADGCTAALRALRILLLLAEATDTTTVAEQAPPYGGEITRIAQLEEIIENRFSASLTNEAIAAMLYISPRQLTRIVKKRYGTTLHAVITQKRVEAARSMLLLTGLCAEDIAEAVGFRSKSCFYAAFEKAYALSPKEYRRQHKG